MLCCCNSVVGGGGDVVALLLFLLFALYFLHGVVVVGDCYYCRNVISLRCVVVPVVMGIFLFI